MEIQIEEWRDIKGLEGLYQISNKGRVKSIRNNIILKTGVVSKRQGTGGYKVVNLKSKIRYIHRLVAESFLDNPKNLPQVNHIDGNKFNNNVSNLEWCTAKENMKHAYKIGLMPIHIPDTPKLREWKKKFGEKYKATKETTIFKEKWFQEKYQGQTSKKVIQIDKDGNKIKIWESIILASKTLNIDKGNISACCRNKRKTAGGYIWKFN